MNSSILMIVVLFALMYFMMIRPQKKAQEKQKSMLSNIKPGTEVVTIGGLHAKVSSVSADRKTVSLDADGSFLTYEMSAIRTVVPDETQAAPVATDAAQTDEVSETSSVVEETEAKTETEQLAESVKADDAVVSEKSEDNK